MAQMMLMSCCLTQHNYSPDLQDYPYLGRCLDFSDNDLIKLGNFPPLKRSGSCFHRHQSMSSTSLRLALRLRVLMLMNNRRCAGCV